MKMAGGDQKKTKTFVTEIYKCLQNKRTSYTPNKSDICCRLPVSKKQQTQDKTYLHSKLLTTCIFI